VCRSKPVAAQISKHEKEIRDSMKSHLFEKVDIALNNCESQKADIDVRLKHDAEVLHKKLG